jgi:hypothetical protein
VFPGSPGELLVVDVDRLSLLDFDLPTPTALSGREDGGKHFYFRCDPNLPARRMEWGDINPAYVLVPGSMHPSGQIYEWLPDRSPEDVELLPFSEVASMFGVEEIS